MNKREPIIEKLWNYKGYNCAVLFLPRGHRCGYVEVPKESKYYGKSYTFGTTSFFYDIDVNGGITYSDNYLYSISSKKEDRWWIGWDYAHCWNGFDNESYLKYYGKDSNYESQIECMLGVVDYLSDVARDCERVVEQLIELENCEVEE